MAFESLHWYIGILSKIGNTPPMCMEASPFWDCVTTPWMWCACTTSTKSESQCGQISDIYTSLHASHVPDFGEPKLSQGRPQMDLDQLHIGRFASKGLRCFSADRACGQKSGLENDEQFRYIKKTHIEQYTHIIRNHDIYIQLYTYIQKRSKKTSENNG